tara:strand:+ start:273 stop:632 length:360 start_codon:yes stop_codon:yes gene_type:complete
MYQHGETGTWANAKYTLEEVEREERSVNNFARHTLIAKRLYTGLKDSEGVEIYEGDIVTGLRHGNLNILGSLVCHSASWWVEYYHPHEEKLYVTFLNGVRSIKIIGNIYQNPELLKQGE